MRFLLSSTLLLASSLLAKDLDNRISKLESEMQDVRVKTVYGNYGAKTVSAYPDMNTWGTYWNIEGLYLKFTEGGMDYAWTDQNVAGTSFEGSLKYLDFDWRFAFRVTAGYQFESPDWDLWAEYMRFDSTQSRSTSTPTDGRLFSDMFSRTTIDGFTKLKLDVNYNTIDLNLGRNFFLRRNVSMHPFVGLRGAWIDQKETVEIDAVSGTAFNMKQKNDYGGVGLHTGTSGRWHLDRNWSLFGSISGALMWGQFNNTLDLTQTATGVTTSVLDLDTDTRRILPNMMADIGLTWQYFFSRARIAFTLGYEFDYWWRQNQTVHINPSATSPATSFVYYRISEDLGLQGVKLNMGLDF